MKKRALTISIGGIIIILFIALILVFSHGGTNTNSTNSSNQSIPAKSEMLNMPDSTLDMSQKTTTLSEKKAFLQQVFENLKAYWKEEFEIGGFAYHDPKLVLFAGDSITTEHGEVVEKAEGPVYLSGEETIFMQEDIVDYINETFSISDKAASAGILAHEFGHHIQNLNGVFAKTSEYYNELVQGEITTEVYSNYNVRMELQADYYAGMFLKYLNAKGRLSKDNFNAVLELAKDSGWDSMPGVAQQNIKENNKSKNNKPSGPDLGQTHGTSAQRVAWIKRGYEYGDFEHADTFTVKNLDHPEK